MKHLFLAFVAVGLLIACNPKTVEVIPEVVSTEEPEESMPLADIGEGKVVFLDNCISCHYGRNPNRIPELIDQFTQEEWNVILPKMLKKAELDDDKSRQVTAYIGWELNN